MNTQARLTVITSQSFFFSNKQQTWNIQKPFVPLCSKKDKQEPEQNGKGDKFSVDWDKAWKNFKTQGKKSLFSGFSPNKYVTWNPRRSDYPSSEEVDPIKRTERTNLSLWTSPTFTLAGSIVIVTFLLLYTLLAPPT